MDLETLTKWCQNSLGDPAGATWSSSLVQQWIVEALWDYGTHLGKTITVDGETGQDVHAYPLPAGTGPVARVEYPAGQDPPRYLTRLSRRDPRFWSGDGFYDVEPSRTSAQGPTLWISAKTADGEAYAVTCLAGYAVVGDEPEGEGEGGLDYPDPADIPENHLPVIAAFVAWRAAQYRWFQYIASPAAGPNPPEDVMDWIPSYTGAVRQARDTYEAMIAKITQDLESESQLTPWRVDRYDRIY